MSEQSAAAAFLEASLEEAPALARSLFVAGRAGELAEFVLHQLNSDSSWAREQALARLCTLPDYEPLLEPLAAALADDDDAERRNAARTALATLAGPGAAAPAAALRKLRELIHSPDLSDVRLLAASALGESGNPAARHDLESALADPQPNVVSAASDALGILGDTRAVPALLEIAGRGDFWIRASAIVALGRLGDSRAIPVLTAALKEGWLTSAAASSLGAIGDPAGLEPLRPLIEAGGSGREEGLRSAAAIFAQEADSAVPAWLREALAGEVAELERRLSEDDDIEAGRLLGLAGTRPAAAALVRSLDIPGREDAVAAGLALLPGEVVGETVLECISRGGDEGRVLLLGFLPPLETQTAVEIVVRQLSDPNAEIRAAAAEALGRSSDSLVLPALERAIADPGTQQGAALAYARLGSTSCGPLVGLLKSSQPSVRAAAAEGLARCGDRYVADLRAALRVEHDPTARHAIVRSLGASRTEDALEELVSLLKDGDPEMRFAAVQALGRTRLDSAVDPLITALSDERPEIRASALAALGEVGDARAGQSLANHLDVPDRDLRRTAIFALERIDRPAVAGQMVRALRDPDREVRLTAVHVLARMNDPQGRIALGEVAEMDPEELVRQAAKQALGSLPAAGSPGSG
jgi:HEAT repeat protein